MFVKKILNTWEARIIFILFALILLHRVIDRHLKERSHEKKLGPCDGCNVAEDSQRMFESSQKDSSNDTVSLHSQNLCKEFKFDRSSSDSMVYINRPMFRPSEIAYLIDLGTVCIDKSKIKVSRGGENVTTVLGRSESDEFPTYQKGAITVYGKKPKENTGGKYQKSLLQSAVNKEGKPAKIDVPGTTLANTRGNYANICFVFNDFFNIYTVLQHVQAAKRILWLDGHALSGLDDATSSIFDLQVLRIGHQNGTKCFERLVLLPEKYLFYYTKKVKSCDITHFIKKIWKQYSIVPSQNKHDTVIIRDYYLAHPRVTKEVTRKFTDDDLKNIKAKLPGAKFIRFHEMELKDQLQIIANTKTLYGMHGAGLTLGVFLQKGSKMVEWVHPSRTSQMTFQNMMSWRPDVEFRRLPLIKWLREDKKQS